MVYNGIGLGRSRTQGLRATSIAATSLRTQRSQVLSDVFDGGNFFSGSGDATGNVLISGTATGVPVSERITLMSARFARCSSASVLTLTPPSRSTCTARASPVSIDWEGSVITEEVSTHAPTHSYKDEYILGVYHVQ